MMKRSHRVFAALMAAVMLTAQAGYLTYAQEGETPEATAQAAAEPATEPQTQATEPPTEPQTQATEPQTQATEPQTQATEPLSEPQTQAAEKSTESSQSAEDKPKAETAAETQTETSSQNTEAEKETAVPESEKQSEKTSEKESESEKETETETESETEEKLTDTFTGTVDKATVTVKLAKKDKQPESTQLVLTKITDQTDAGLFEKLKKVIRETTNHGHRELHRAAYYKIELKTKDGEPVTLKQAMTVTFAYSQPKSLKLDGNLSPEVGVYAMTDHAQRIADAAVDGSWNVKSFTVSGKNISVLALGGIEDHINDGAQVSMSSVLGELSFFLPYGVVADAQGGDESALPKDALIAGEREKDGKESAGKETAAGESAQSEEAQESASSQASEGAEAADPSAASSGEASGDAQGADDEGKNAEGSQAEAGAPGEESSQSGDSKAETSAADPSAAQSGESADAESSGSGKKEDKSEKELPSAGEIRAALGGLSGFSLTLANAVSSSTAAVVNLYADANGTINTNPMKAVLSGGAIDVSGRMVIINVAASAPGQSLTLPVFPVAGQGGSDSDRARSAGRVIYNVYTQGAAAGERSAFTGSVSLSGSGYGIYLAPSGALSLGGSFVGSAYTSSIYLADGMQFISAHPGNEPASGETSTDTSDQKDGTKGGKETVSEGETEAETEQGEPVSEPATAPDEMLVGIGAAQEDILEAEEVLADEGDVEIPLYAVINDSWTDSPISGGSVSFKYGNVELQVKDGEDNALMPKPSIDPVKASGSSTSSGTNNLPRMLKVILPDSVANQLRTDAAGAFEITVNATAPTGYTADGETTKTVTVTYTAASGTSGESFTVNNPGKDSSDPVTFYAINAAQVAVIALKPVYGSGEIPYPAQYGGLTATSNADTLSDWAKVREGKLYIKLDALKEKLDAAAAETSVEPEITLSVSETANPAFYTVKDAEKTKTVKLKYTPAGTDGTAPTESSVTITDPTATTANPAELSFDHDRSTITFTVQATDQDTGTIVSEGTAAFAVTVPDNHGGIVSANPANGTGNTIVYTLTPAVDSTLMEKLYAGETLTLTVTETTVPEGYEDPAQKEQTVTLSWNPSSNGGELLVTSSLLAFPHTMVPKVPGPTTIYLQDESGNALNGGTFNIYNSKGELVMEDVPVVNGKAEVELTTIDTYTISQMGFPTNYVMAAGESADKTVTLEAGKEKSVTFHNRTVSSNEQIRITKRLYVGSKSTRPDTYGMIYNPSSAVTYYVALFSDAAKTQRVTPLYTLTVDKAHPYKVFTLSNLPQGTYYIGETDAAGNVVPGSQNDNMWVTFSTSAKDTDRADKVTIAGNGSRHSLTMNNRYSSIPSGFQYVAPIGLKKVVRNADGSKDTSFNGTVRLRATYGSVYQQVTLNVSRGESGTSYVYIPLGRKGSARTVKITELTEKKSTIKNTAVLSNGKSYTVSMDKSSVSVQKGSSSQTVTVTNTEVDAATAAAAAAEAAGEKTQAVLKLTKKVTYKGQPIRVNSVYYIGIFDDPQLKKLRYKKALQFKNASEMTSSLKINLYKLSSREVTFYFAEVDRNGNVVEGGERTGYNITQNKQSIKLDMTNLEDELIITNDVLAGTRREQQLLDPGSGFAGDRAALAEAQQLENVENASPNTVTEDSTPVQLWVTVLLTSLLAMGAVLLARRRRRV